MVVNSSTLSSRRTHGAPRRTRHVRHGDCPPRISDQARGLACVVIDQVKVAAFGSRRSLAAAIN